MKRDNDYIRTILLEIEQQERPYVVLSNELSPSLEKMKYRYHIQLLCDAGFMASAGGDAYRLTNQGHDYIEAIRSDTIWTKTREGAEQLAGVTLGMMRDIAVAYLKREAHDRLGLPI